VKTRWQRFDSSSGHMTRNTTSPGDNGGRKSSKGVEFKPATKTKDGDKTKRWTGIDIDGNPSVNPSKRVR
jgi:hypothetical protein